MFVTGMLFVTGRISDQAVFGDTTHARNSGTSVFIAKIDSTGKFVWVVPGTGGAG